jgi:hypothetical protein
VADLRPRRALREIPKPRRPDLGEPLVRSWPIALALLGVAILIALVLRDRGGLLALGLLVGALAACGAALLLAVLRPTGALLIAARPLGIALLLILAAGTVDSPLALQLVAGVGAMLLALHLLVWPEWPELAAVWERMTEAPRTPAQRARRRRWVAGGVALAAVVVVLAIVLPPGGSLEARGGLAAFLFSLAVVLLALCAIVRLGGYARSIPRLVVAVLMLLAGVRLAMSAGLLPGDDAFSWLTPTLLVALAGLGLLVATAVDVWSWITVQRSDDPTTRGMRRAIALERPVVPLAISEGASALGLAAALLASIALLGAMVLSANPGRATGAIADALDASAPGRPPAGLAAMSDEQLARSYAPLLVFSGRALWSPIDVDEYVANAGDRLKIVDWEHRPVDRSKLRTLTDCPTIVPVPCYLISTGCAAAEDPCAQPRPGREGERRRDGAVYVRVVRRGAPRPDQSPNAFDRVAPFGDRVTRLVQYWFFYAYDDWVSPVIAGQLRQYHEADWEAVTIGFSDTAPLFVGFSQHCGGEWYRWRDVRVTGGTHTVVAAAEGSQANYRFPNASQAPDWTGCANLPARTTTLVSYASNIRDRTGADWSWSPPEDGFRFVDAREFPMNVVARWAPYSRTELQTLRRTHRLGNDAAGPATPSAQALWREPLRTIFTSPRWHEGEE